MDYYRIAERVLSIMNQGLLHLQNGEKVEIEGESGSLTNDEELRADVVLGDIAEQILREYTFVRTIEIEGREIVEVSKEGTIDVKVDQLDASLNYKHRGNLNAALPYSGVITFVQHKDKGSPSFCDVVAAGVMNFASPIPDFWYAGLNASTLINGQNAVRYTGEFGLTKIPVIGEFYYPSNRRMLTEIFSNEKGYLRNCGSAAVEMCFVSSGQAAAFICDKQKGHELGAAYLMVMQSGGVVVDWNGYNLEQQTYDFSKQYSVILATSREVADKLVNRIKQIRIG